jgi:hypothetical protein
VTVGEVPRLPAGLVEELRRQVDRCRPTSPLYAALLAEMAADAESGGITASLLNPYRDDPLTSVPGLRLLAAVHQLVLEGRLQRLAAFYPTTGGTEPPEGAWPVFHSAMIEHADELRALIAAPIQTNEPGRAAVLFGGALAVAATTGLPVRLLEIGASAGLNLRADQFGYRVGGRILGDPVSPLVLDEPWRGTPPADLDTPLRVVERRGCDTHPIDPVSDEGATRLASLIWADPPRLARLRAAIAVAEQVPATVDQAPADEWLAEQLAEPVPGAVTVVWHSVVRQYVDPAQWRRVGEVLTRAGSFATADAPVAHLAFEPDIAADGTYTFSVRLTLWPTGRTEALATAHGHGPPVTWRMGV